MLRSQLLKGTVSYLVLSVLVEDELYGYEIARRIRERSGDFLAPSEGSLYPALHALERDRAIVAEWRPSDRGARRRYYRLTPRGQQLLAQSRADWDAFARAVSNVTEGSPA
jgi:PadR family transcriptional regulator PadR